MSYQSNTTGRTYNKPTTAPQGKTAHTAHATGTQAASGSAAAGSATGGKREILFSTGLFKPTKEGVKSIASVQVKEDTMLKAGSYINIYVVDDRSLFKNPDNAPDFMLKVTEGQLKAK